MVLYWIQQENDVSYWMQETEAIGKELREK